MLDSRCESARDEAKSRRCREATYLERASVVALEGDDGLAPRLEFNPILGTEARDDLDAVCRGHGDSSLTVSRP